MTDTIISSATKEVVIGFGRPFVMIGERINPTGRKLLAEEMKNGDFSRVVADAIAQVEAGAQMLDVNAGIPLADEPALLVRAIKEVQAVTDVPTSGPQTSSRRGFGTWRVRTSHSPLAWSMKAPSSTLRVVVFQAPKGAVGPVRWA